MLNEHILFMMCIPINCFAFIFQDFLYSRYFFMGLPARDGKHKHHDNIMPLYYNKVCDREKARCKVLHYIITTRIFVSARIRVIRAIRVLS